MSTSKKRNKQLAIFLTCILVGMAVVAWCIFGTPAQLSAHKLLASNLGEDSNFSQVKAAGTSGGALGLYSRYFIAFSGDSPGGLKPANDLKMDSRSWEQPGLQNIMRGDVKTEGDAIARCKHDLIDAFADEKAVIEVIPASEVQGLCCFSYAQQCETTAVLLSHPASKRYYLCYYKNYMFSPGG
jgi:hypothetical protein